MEPQKVTDAEKPKRKIIMTTVIWYTDERIMNRTGFGRKQSK
jgi:hypothetical protein